MRLAINGGDPVRPKNKPFPRQLTTREEEAQAAYEVVKAGHLSRYRGTWSQEFWGGPQIQALEREFCERFGFNHAIAVNSCTSALMVACGAAGLAPGDEVIVTPWSMTCSATAPLMWNAIPVFADIEPDFFCLDPESIRAQITEKTRAIIIVDLFGQTYDYDAISSIAEEYGLVVIEDAAQAIGARYNNRYAGNLGHMGCFSFTQGKHLTAGEGGMIVTGDPLLAMRCRLIRNHAEAVVNEMASDEETLAKYAECDLCNNMLGFNMRMTEVQAAILRVQLDRLQGFIAMRQSYASRFISLFADIPAIRPCRSRVGSTHVFYVQPWLWDREKADGMHRDDFINAVRAELPGEEGRENEGVIGCGYIKPLYKMPLFLTEKLYGGMDYPFSQRPRLKRVSFGTVESLWKDELWLWRLTSLPLAESDIDDITEAFCKVWSLRDQIARTK